MFVDCRWEEQEISGSASLLELGIQLGYDLLRRESPNGFDGSHDPLSESWPGITMEVDGGGSDRPGTGSVATHRRSHMN